MGFISSGGGAAPDNVTLENNASGQLALHSSIPRWHHIETLEPSGVNAIATTGTLTVYKRYMVKFNLETSALDNLRFTINGDTGNNYSIMWWSNLTLTYSASLPEGFLGALGLATQNKSEAFIGGKTSANASGNLIYNMLHFGAPSANRGAASVGYWTGGNDVQVTAFNFFCQAGATNMTGEIKVYGSDDI